LEGETGFRRLALIYNLLLVPLAAVGLAAVIYTAREGGAALYASIGFVAAAPFLAYLATLALTQRSARDKR